jgi:hypothetical protein
MNRSTICFEIFVPVSLAVALGIGGSVSVWADEPTAPLGQTDKEVQERAVPRAGMPSPSEKQPQGMVLQGNRVQALPGYLLQQGSKNSVSARQAIGGIGVGSATCGCAGDEGGLGTGSCYMDLKGGSALCSSDHEHPCNGRCTWINTSATANFSIK